MPSGHASGKIGVIAARGGGDLIQTPGYERERFARLGGIERQREGRVEASAVHSASLRLRNGIAGLGSNAPDRQGQGIVVIVICQRESISIIEGDRQRRTCDRDGAGPIGCKGLPVAEGMKGIDSVNRRQFGRGLCWLTVEQELEDRPELQGIAAAFLNVGAHEPSRDTSRPAIRDLALHPKTMIGDTGAPIAGGIGMAGEDLRHQVEIETAVFVAVTSEHRGERVEGHDGGDGRAAAADLYGALDRPFKNFCGMLAGFGERDKLHDAFYITTFPEQ